MLGWPYSCIFLPSEPVWAHDCLRGAKILFVVLGNKDTVEESWQNVHVEQRYQR